MIKYNPSSWLSLIFHRTSKEIFKRTIPNLIFILLYTTAFTASYVFFFHDSFNIGNSVHNLLGIILGLFLVFRMNSAYDKWWEGRILWGSMVNDSRNLAIKLKSFTPKDEALRKRFVSLITNYVVAVKEHLRTGVDVKDLSFDDDMLTSLAQKNHKPNFIVSELYSDVNDLYKSGEISGEQLFLLDKELKGLTDNLGACERIKNTPIPYSYSMYIKKFIFIYSITLPFGFVNAFEWWTILVTAFIFYFLITIEFIAEEIEDPFGKDDNDLPTDELSKKIGNDVKEILLG